MVIASSITSAENSASVATLDQCNCTLYGKTQQKFQVRLEKIQHKEGCIITQMYTNFYYNKLNPSRSSYVLIVKKEYCINQMAPFHNFYK